MIFMMENGWVIKKVEKGNIHLGNSYNIFIRNGDIYTGDWV